VVAVIVVGFLAALISAASCQGRAFEAVGKTRDRLPRPQGQVPISRAVSMGPRNTKLKV